MSRFEMRFAGERRRSRSAAEEPWVLLIAGFSLVCLNACRQQMADQPRHAPLTASSFFEDGASARAPVAGSVPLGSLAEDSLRVSPDTDSFPIPVTQALLVRGRERFEIFCSVCHGLAGDGNGMVVRRGFPPPPSYHTDRLRAASLGHFYDVVTEGYGFMPSYAAEVPRHDRWAIIAYIRALQLSQHARIADLPAAMQSRLKGSP